MFREVKPLPQTARGWVGEWEPVGVDQPLAHGGQCCGCESV